MAIRYDKEYNKEINRILKNYNQKVKRLEREHEYLMIPNKITKQELKSNYLTRKSLNRKLRELKRFSQRGAEETVVLPSGAMLSKYELENLQRESRRVKGNLTREIKRLEVEKPKVFGKKQAATFAQMGDDYYLNTVARRKALDKNIKTLTEEEYQRYKELVEKTIRNESYYNEIFRENYYNMLTDLAYQSGYDPEKISELRRKLNRLDDRQFLKLFRSEKSIQAVVDNYDLMKKMNNARDREEAIKDIFNLYDNIDESIDMILKDYA